MGVGFPRAHRRVQDRPRAVKLGVQRGTAGGLPRVVGAHRAVRARRVLDQAGRVHAQRTHIVYKHPNAVVLLGIIVRIRRKAERIEQVLQSGAALRVEQVDAPRFEQGERQRFPIKQQRFRINRIRLAGKLAGQATEALLRGAQHAFVRVRRGGVQRARIRAHKQLAAARRINQRLNRQVALPGAAHPAGCNAQRDRAVIAQQRAVPGPQGCDQLRLFRLLQLPVRQYRRPQRTDRFQACVDVGQAVLHAVKLSVRGQRELRGLGRRHAGRA